VQASFAQVALFRADERTNALRETLAELLRLDEPRTRFAAMISGLDIHYDLGEGHPLLGRRMPDVGGGEKPPDSGGETRVSEAPPGTEGDTSIQGLTAAPRRRRSGIKKLFGELKREVCGNSKQRARKSRKRVDHQKEADFNPHQHRISTWSRLAVPGGSSPCCTKPGRRYSISVSLAASTSPPGPIAFD